MNHQADQDQFFEGDSLFFYLWWLFRKNRVTLMFYMRQLQKLQLDKELYKNSFMYLFLWKNILLTDPIHVGTVSKFLIQIKRCLASFFLLGPIPCQENQDCAKVETCLSLINGYENNFWCLRSITNSVRQVLIFRFIPGSLLRCRSTHSCLSDTDDNVSFRIELKRGRRSILHRQETRI